MKQLTAPARLALVALATLSAAPAVAVVNQKLSAELAAGKGDISGASRYVDEPFEIDPTSRYAVYIADQETDGVFELWSVPLAGGEPTRLNAPLVAGGDVSGAADRVNHPFRISPDGGTVVYLADQETDDVFELFSVAITGGQATKLNPPLAGGSGDVRGTDPEVDEPFRITPDGQRVVYLADQETDDMFGLWSVPIGGGPAVRLTPPMALGEGDVHAGAGVPFRISPDSRYVVYVADQEADEVFELFRVPVTGGQPTKLNPALAGGRGDIHLGIANPFEISPDSQHVVYLADQSRDDVFELFSVPIAGGRSVRLNPRPAPGGQVGGASDDVAAPFRITSDSRRVVFLGDLERDDVVELWSAPIAGGTHVKLNADLTGGGNVAGADKDLANPFVLSPDGQRAVYVADQETDNVFELWSVPVTGGPVVKLNGPLADGRGDIRGPSALMANPFRVSPDSKRVLYIADQAIDSVFELWSVPIEGGPSVRLNVPLSRHGGEVRGADNLVANPFLITADSAWAVYCADQEVIGVMELYRVPIAGGRVVKLNPTLNHDEGTIMGADYEVNSPFKISPDGRYAVYIADQAVDELYELHASALFGMNVQGGGQDIVDDDWAPEPDDGTDFGVATRPISQTFTVGILDGDGLLTLGTDAVTLSGPESADFTVTSQPMPSVAAGDTTTFTIRFEPRAAGIRRAIVSIRNDMHETPYRFAIQGKGEAAAASGAR